MPVMIVNISNLYKRFDKFKNNKYSTTKKASSVTGRNKVTIERIFVEVCNVFHVATPTRYNQKVWPAIYKVRWEISLLNQEFNKLLDPFKTRGYYLQ